MLQVVHRVITRFLLGQAGLKADEAGSSAVTLIQRFGSAANLNIHLHCLVLDGVYRRGIDGTPAFVEVPGPTDEALLSVLHKIITRMMKLLTRRGVLVEEEVRPPWPTTKVIRTRPARSGRCRPPRVLVASPSARALGRRC
ncbi:MAG: transposase [Aquabacterium sp.]